MSAGPPPKPEALSAEDRELLGYLLEKEGVLKPSTRSIPVRPDPRTRPLSLAQERLLFLSRLEADAALYIIPLAVRLEGSLDVNALRRAFTAIVARHEVLRTVLPGGGQGQPQLADPEEVILPLLDLRDREPKEREAELQRQVRVEARRPFELTTGPHLRATLLRLQENEHALLMSVHHVVADAWSLGVLVQELAAFYRELVGGPAASLPPLPVQYADFAHWQRETLRSGLLEAQVDYWRHRLAGAPPVLELPTDRPRPPVQGSGGATVRQTFSPKLLQDLGAFARREGATLFMVLLAGFKALLARYTGETDLVVGTPIANRTRKEVEALIGLFVNTLVLRTDCAGDPSLGEIVRRVRETALQAYAHQDVPFEKVVEALNPARAASHSPLFQIAFNLQNAPLEALQLEGLTLRPIETATNTAKFDLALYLAETASGLRAVVEYAANLYDASTVERMLGHFGRVLEQMVARPEARLSELALLDAEERRLLLVEWSGASTNEGEGAALSAGAGLVHEEFANRSRSSPEAPALVFGGDTMTYGDLDARGNQWARLLRARGIGPEVRVGLCVDHGPRLVLGALAILKAGGAYVALDPDLPPERLSYMLRDSRAELVLTEGAFEGKVAQAGLPILCLDGPAVDGECSDPIGTSLHRESLAYVIYTSGSTGLPKGVELTHGGLANLVEWHGRTYGVRPEDRATQLAGLGFDASVWELWPYLAAGASLRFPEREVRLNPGRLRHWLVQERISLTFLPTPLAEAVLQGSWPEGGRLRALLTGGDRLHERPTPGLGFELVNHYGPTENTVVATAGVVGAATGAVEPAPSIGRPVTGVRVYLLDLHWEPVPVGVWGEMFLGGRGLARGYAGRADLTAAAFVPDPFSGEAGARLYRTGDRCRYREDGSIEFGQRFDRQVKVRGHRIELGEIETALQQHAQVQEAAVVLQEERPGHSRLVAYLVWQEGAARDSTSLGDDLRRRLPEYMVPRVFVDLDRLPVNASGKVDREALPAAAEGRGESAAQASGAPSTDLERGVAQVWGEVLGKEIVGRHDNFFDLGGHSLLLVQVHEKLRTRYPDVQLKVVDLFQYPTVHALANRLGDEGRAPLLLGAAERGRRGRETKREEIAVIGMAGRFPKAHDITELWRRLRAGEECLTSFSDEELRASGVAEELIRDPRYVRARGLLEGVELFDAAFFGYTPREAEVLDPQQRIFLECAFEALENAGTDAERYQGAIGLYAGVGLNRYLLQLASEPELLEGVDAFSLLVGSDKDFLPTRVSYKLNLRGPSVNVQTACSTSLVAVHLACQALSSRECDMALAGGVSIAVPQQVGYQYQEEGIGSPDGHCRPFDANARGTVSGSGVGIVVLKRLEDALRAGDPIRAVIRGSAINNDGGQKVGYTAPSVTGQAEVITAALAAADVAPETIGYVEAHGTGTALGDPIEVEALTQAFRAHTDARTFCALGSLKSNLGHLDAAAGVAGLIKAVLALEHGEIPPSVNFSAPNPRIDFETSPFRVSTAFTRWESTQPRRAGVSSFGIGGTNAHVVLEEAPAPASLEPGRPGQLLVLSARSGSALEEATHKLRAHLESDPEAETADVAYTLQIGRRVFAHRRAVLVRDHADAVAALSDPKRFEDGLVPSASPRVVFLFPGQGAQHVGMGQGLYSDEPVFRQVVDECAAILHESLGLDLREVLYPEAGKVEVARERLGETALTQPALFVVELALARLWMSLGVRPAAMIGHSLGEFVAAHLSGVFTLHEALQLVAARGRLMQQQPRGAMLAVPLSEDAMLGLLGERLALAAVNARELCVVSGPTDAVDELQRSLAGQGVEARRLATSHAFHSAMMDGALDAFRSEVARVGRKAPRLPFLSNVTGDWITPEQAQDPAYWSGHLRACVRFTAGLDRLSAGAGEGRILLEVGPGQTLATLARQQVGAGCESTIAVTSLRHAKDERDDRLVFLRAVGRLWASGVSVEWEAAHADAARRRVALPSYPFERRRYWIEPTRGRRTRGSPVTVRREKRTADPADFFYVPSWVRRPRPYAPRMAATRWLLLGEGHGLASRIEGVLVRAGHSVSSVVEGASFEVKASGRYAVRPSSAEDHLALLALLRERGEAPEVVLHLWSVSGPSAASGLAEAERALDLGLVTMMHLARALGAGAPDRVVRVGILSDGMQEVAGEGLPHPEKAPLLGPCRVAPVEYPNLRCRSLDLAVRPAGEWDEREIEDWLFDLADAGSVEPVVAYRGGERFVQSVEPLRLEGRGEAPLRLRQGGCYLITGGLGGIGLAVAEKLARTVGARLVLTGRNPLPNRETWPSVVDERTRQRIDRVQALEALGAEVLIVGADAADRRAMREAFDAAEARFGRVDGVVHAAGVPGGGALEGRTRDQAMAVLRPKVAGTLVLDALARERNADFLVFCSSLASVLGGFGQSDYCGANAFLDAWARHARAKGGPFTASINWDRWREVGMAVEAALPDDLARARQRDLAHGLGTADGAEAFVRILGERQPQVLVSTRELKARLEGWRFEDAAAEAQEPGGAEAVDRPPPAPRHPRPALDMPFVAPRDEWERAVAEVFEGLLGFAPVGVHDGFFELGGHSLLATQVLTRLNAAFGSRLTLRGLFEGSTVAALAAQIRAAAVRQEETASRAAGSTAAAAASGSEDDEARVLSFTQERMWFLDRLEPGNPAFNLGLAFRCRGRLDVEALERAIQEIVSRHDVLRTRFPESDGRPAPAVEAEARVELRRLDLRGTPEGEREATATAAAAAELQRPFDLSQAPLLRAACLRLGERDHVLLLSAHHIVADGWSMGVFTRELGALYAAYTAGRPSPLAPLSMQYGAHARHEREPSEAGFEAAIDYWRRQLADAPPLLELPTDHDPDPSQPVRSGSETLELGEVLAARLRELGQCYGVTLFMVLQGALQSLLSRLSGQTDIVVGTPVANRTSEEAEALIGPFLNTLALRVDHSGDPSFRELLARVRAVTMDALAHQDVPFERVLEALHVRRDLAHPPLFRVFFNMLSFAEIRLDLPDLALTPFKAGAPDAKFDLTLYATERGGRIAFSASYRADLFEASTLRRLLSRLERLLEQVAAEPERPLSTFSLVIPEERGLLPDPADPLAEVPVEVVPRLFEAWAARTPHAVALRQSGRELSYTSLEQASSSVGRRLLAAGLAAGDVVAVEGAQSFGLVVSLLGVLRSGGALLALDGSLPSGRRHVMREEAQARFRLVVGDAEEIDSPAPAVGAGVVIPVDSETGEPLVADPHAPLPSLPELRGDDPAYVFFTSGTTGVPKGVLGCHKGLGHFVTWQRDTFTVGPGDRSSQLTGLSFDVVMREIFLPLVSGATLCLPPAGRELGPDRVLRWLQEEGVTVLHTVPTLARTWLLETPSSVALPALRLVFMAGEPLTGRLVRQWRSRFPGSASVVNLYGPTETTLAKCFEVVGDTPRDGVQPVGRPLPQTQALVLGPGGQPCGVAEPGEIVLRTPFRSLGYVNAPDETRRRFVPNAFRSDSRDLLYRTGDRGRYLADGRLEILGRLDHQVKVRGARVELGEVESVLAQHPAVAECVVLAVAEAEEDARLAAYVVPRRGDTPDPALLRQYLKDRLPDYMVPSAVTFLAVLPLTANGKLDRRALPAPAWAAAIRATDTAPRSPVEEQVAAIWQELLDVSAVGAHDDFFDLGGHSLLATRVAARLRREFGVELPLRRLFEATTVALLAQEVQALLAGGGTLLEPVTARERVDDEVPASFAQQRLWFLQQLQPESAAYNIAHAVRLQGALDLGALERALSEIVRRHDVLRTTFQAVGGRPVQRVAPPRPLWLSVADLRAVSEDGQALELRRLAREDAQRPFDLTAGPLFRAGLVRLGDEQCVLLLSMHHTVSDSWSLGLLARELNALYPAFREGRPSPLPELPIQYADYAVWQVLQLETGALDAQLAYWTERLAGVSVLDLPGDRPRPSLPSGRGARLAFALPDSLMASLEAVGRARGATRFMLLLAGFQALLHRYTGDTDLAVGTPIANRRAAELDGLIGFFVNMLALRTDLSGDPSFGQLVERVREVALGAYANQDVPFEKLVEELHPERSLGQNPLFQVMFILQTAPRERLALPGLVAGAAPTDLSRAPEPAAARFDLTLDLTDWGGRVSGFLEYNKDLFDDATAARIVEQFQALLEGAAQDPQRRLSELPLITPQEERLLLEEWNWTEQTFPCVPSLSAAFEAQVARTPDAEALREAGRSTDYRSLNAAANRMAHHLRRLGVGPEVVVGLCLERSVETVIILLGILKAGGAFLPLDPSHPKERLALMVEDSRARVVVTRRGLAGVLGREGVRLVCLDTEDDVQAVAEQSPLDLGLDLDPEMPAYVIYTSGSTGRPKGVVGAHRGALNRFHWMWRRYPFTPGEVCAQKTSLTFVDSIWEVFGPLLAGVPAVVVPDSVVKDPRLLLETLAEARATRLVLVPSLLRALLARPGGSSGLLPALRLWFTSGEALPVDLARLFREKVPHGTLVNLYGSSEAAADSTGHEVDPETDVARIPIGRPIANTRVYVLDATLRPVPRGVPGELYIGGAGLARGYLHRPELTAERFLPNPFEAGSRLYRTGDRARFRADGEIEYLGRVDHQVKVRGVRVELAEVEAALRREASVRDAVVVAQSGPGGSQLVAYVVARSGELRVFELRRALRDRLPEPMVPAAIVVLEALPLTPSGKVDRLSLPAPDPVSAEMPFAAPNGPVEEVLAGIWDEVLGRRGVGAHDSFFDLGGHSLLATQLVVRMRDLLGVEVPLARVFEHPTVAGLGQFLAATPHVERRAAALLRLSELSEGEVEEMLGAGASSGEGEPR
jgi:amino acid adenylation domain-containing protein